MMRVNSLPKSLDYQQANMSEYIFSSEQQEKEYKRLSLLADSFDEKSHKHLLFSGLKEGMKVLEVGLGTGSIASWMSEQVGQSGSVTGVDLRTDYLFDVKEYAVYEGDILDFESSELFDLIHLRYLLIHNQKATQILQKLFTLLKAGGKLVVEEPDFTLAKWIDAKEINACKRVNAAICKMFKDAGLKAYYGSSMHLSLQEVGFEIEESKSYLHLCSGNEAVAEVMKLSSLALEEQYLQTGLCSQEDIQAYRKACEDEGSLAVYYASIAVMASKPDGKSLVLGHEVLDETGKTIKEEHKEGILLASQPSQIQICYPLMKLLRPHLSEENFVDGVQEQMQEGYQLFYLCEGSELMSLAGCRISTNLAWGKHLYIDDLVSSEQARSQGHGKAILDYLKRYAKEQGCKAVHLDSGVARFRAHKFYLREGFEISSHHFAYKTEI